jgi:1-acyl-sn-glycerol-3-phosphate acyltransferase
MLHELYLMGIDIDIGGLTLPWVVLPFQIDAVSRPVLFVGNHTSMGMYDLPLMVHELYLRGFSCRALAHPIHWLGPSGGVIQHFGGTKATPHEVHALLKNGEHLLLFPGGKDEVSGQECSLKGAKCSLDGAKCCLNGAK